MYFPLSQITPNLYTNGEEFVNSLTNEIYIGYYFKVSTGKYYTGRNQNDKPNIELIINLSSNTLTNDPNFIEEQQSNVIYDTLVGYNLIAVEYNTLTQNQYNSLKTIPTFSPSSPTQQDYQVGEFRRFFCKKTNEYQYIEINKDTFAKLASKDTQILWELYQPFFIDWHLTGGKENVAKINKNSTELVIFKNKFLGLNEYLKFDFTKYYNQLGTTTSGSYINGVNQGYVLDNRDRRGNGVFNSQNDSGSIRRDNSITR
jgi:hypothetical protein